MCAKTVYRKIVDPEVGADILPIPDYKTLILESVTDEEPTEAVKVECSSLNDVFEKFQPKVDVAFEGEGGTTVDETLKFNSLNDFGPEGLKKISPYLQQLSEKVEVYELLAATLAKNKPLQEALNNPETRAEIIKGLQAMLIELENHK